MICSQCHASLALKPSLNGLPLADALSADGSHQTWLQGFCHIISHILCQCGLWLLGQQFTSIGCSDDESACQHSCICWSEATWHFGCLDKSYSP